MQEEFWQARWRENNIPFHEARPNALLEQYFDRLELKQGDRVFVPLSGKAIDLDWLGQKSLKVAGAEFNEDAVKEVFERQGKTPQIETVGALKHYSAIDLDIFVGDFFELTAEMLGKVDAIYDRAALVALPVPIRDKYSAHLPKVTGAARQFLISYDYDQSQTDGPPFSVPNVEIVRRYQGIYDVEVLETRPITGRLTKRAVGFENALLLKKAAP